MRGLIITAILTAITAHTASATVISYTLDNVDMNSSTTGSGVFAGTLSGDFTVNGTALVSADITASAATVLGHSFPGFEYTYGIAGANSTLTNGLGQAEPNQAGLWFKRARTGLADSRRIGDRHIRV